MIHWFKRWTPRLVIVDPQREAEVAAMRAEQSALQTRLGINEKDDVQAWLRLHQLLQNYEDRISALERKRK